MPAMPSAGCWRAPGINIGLLRRYPLGSCPLFVYHVSSTVIHVHSSTAIVPTTHIIHIYACVVYWGLWQSTLLVHANDAQNVLLESTWHPFRAAATLPVRILLPFVPPRVLKCYSQRPFYCCCSTNYAYKTHLRLCSVPGALAIYPACSCQRCSALVV